MKDNMDERAKNLYQLTHKRYEDNHEYVLRTFAEELRKVQKEAINKCYKITLDSEDTFVASTAIRNLLGE